MKTVADSKGIVYRLGPRIHAGGEGQVHPVIDRQDLVAKIFDKDMPGYEEKLRWMIAHPPRDPGTSSGHRSIAWPQEILWDSRGNMVGYLMPRIADGKEIIEA